MASKGNIPPNTVWEEVAKECEQYYISWHIGDSRDACLRKRRIIGRVRSILKTTASNAELGWLMLADIYTNKNSKYRALQNALNVSPNNPEAHAELATLYANDKKIELAKSHCIKALQYCKGYALEKEVLSCIQEIAREVGIMKVERMAGQHAAALPRRHTEEAAPQDE